MEIILLGLIAGFIGIAVGTFINLTVFRIRLSGVLGTAMKRDVCIEPAVSSDFFPFASFFAIKERCMGRKSVVEWQYPAVELMTGVLFAALFVNAFSGHAWPLFVETQEWLLLFIRDAVIASFLVVVFVYDLKYHYILDRFSIPAIIIAIIFNILLGADGTEMLLGALLIGAFFSIQFIATRGEWVGGGDIRMGLLMGFLFGIELGIVALLLSYILGAFFGLGLVVTGKRDLHGHMPFGTFMALAIFLTMIAGPTILHWYLGFFA